MQTIGQSTLATTAALENSTHQPTPFVEAKWERENQPQNVQAST